MSAGGTSVNDIVQGGAAILLRLRDETRDGLNLAERRLRRFASRTNRITSGMRFTSLRGGFRDLFAGPLAGIGLFQGALRRTNSQLLLMGQNIASIGSQFTTIVGGALGGFLLTKPLRDFSQLEQLLGRFNAVFRELTPQATRFVESLSGNINQSAIQLRDQAAQFQAVFQGFEFDPSQSFDLTQEFVKATQDLIAFDDNITDSQEAVDKLLGGLTGSNVRGVRTFGANILDTALQAELLAQGINKTTREATQQEKVLARSAIILRALQNSGVTGQAAREVDTLASASRSLLGEVRFLSGEVGASIGNAVASAIRDLVDLIKATREWVVENRGAVAVAFTLVGAFAAIAAAGAGVSISTLVLSSSLRGITPLFGLLLAPLTVTTQLLFGLSSAAIFTAQVMTIQLARTAILAVAQGLTALLSVGGLVVFLFTTMGSAVTTIRAAFGALGLSLSVAFAVANSFLSLSAVMRLVRTIAFDLAITFSTGLADAIRLALSSVASLGSGLARLLASLGPLLPFIVLIGAAAGTTVVVFRAVRAVIGEVIDAMSTLAGGIVSISSAIGDFGTVSFDGIGIAAQATSSFVLSIWNDVASNLSAIFEFIVQEARLTFKGIGDALQAGDYRLAFENVVAVSILGFARIKLFALEQWKQLGPPLIATFQVVWENVRTGFAFVVAYIRDEITNVSNKLLVDFTNAIIGIENALPGADRELVSDIAELVPGAGARRPLGGEELEAEIQKRTDQIRRANNASADAQIAAARASVESAQKAADEVRRRSAEAADERAQRENFGPRSAPQIPDAVSNSRIQAAGTFGTNTRVFGPDNERERRMLEVQQKQLEELRRARQIAQDTRDAVQAASFIGGFQ